MASSELLTQIQGVSVQGRGLELEIRDDRPAGSSPSVEEFEDRCILLSSRGFEEVTRDGRVETGEWECQDCLAVFRDKKACPRCGSANMALITVPAIMTWRYFQDTDGLSNEQVLRRLSKALSLFDQ